MGAPDVRQPLPAATAEPRPDRRLLRRRRLTPAQYRVTFDARCSLAGKYMVVWLRIAPDAARRVGTVASKRTFPTAVARNRARRLLRETFRLQRDGLREDVDMVLVARALIRGMRSDAVAEDFRRICRRGGAWRDAC